MSQPGKIHDDIKMCLKGANGELLTVVIVGTDFWIATDGAWSSAKKIHELDYVLRNGQKWSVHFMGEPNLKFYHTPIPPTPEPAHYDDIFEYVSWDGQQWQANVIRHNTVTLVVGGGGPIYADSNFWFHHVPRDLDLPVTPQSQHAQIRHLNTNLLTPQFSESSATQLAQISLKA